MDAEQFGKLLTTTGIAARAATDEDPTSEVLVLGQDYFMLHVGDDGIARLRGEAGPGEVTRVVADAEIFAEMLHRREHPEQYDDAAGWWSIGVTAAGGLVQIKAPTPPGS